MRPLHLLALFLALLGCDWTIAPLAGPRTDLLDREAEAFFRGPVQEFALTIAPRYLAELRDEPRKYVPATVKVGTNVFQKVAIHLKGAAGSTRSIDDKPALTLNFDKFADGQNCFGLDKLHLNNSVQDNSYLNEYLASELYRRAGVPTARTTHAFVRLNGRDLGLYVLKEGYDNTFIRRNFPGAAAPGNLYDGGFVQDIDQDLELDAGKGPTDHSDLQRLRAAAEAPAASRGARLESILNVDRFLSFLAIQTLTDDWDGYGRNRNNYRIYFDPRTGRAEFIPHGMDQLFKEVDASIDPDWNGIVAARALRLPELAARYRARLLTLATNGFTLPILTSYIAEVEARLQPALARRPQEEQNQLRQGFQSRQRRVAARVESVQRQLGLLPKPQKPTRQQPLLLTGWQPRTREGNPKLDISREESGEALHLAASGTGTVGSFRTTQRLPAGSYVFTAGAKSKDLVARKGPQGTGAGIRISGANRENQIAGSRAWTPLSFDFDLSEERSVEFIAELRADQGEVWFDLSSLKVAPR